MSGIDDALREDLNALIDGELSAERAAELRTRLEEDDVLRREYETLRRTAEAVRALPPAGAPAELMARLRAQRPAAPVFRLRPWLAAAAVIAVAVTAGFFAFREDPTPRSSEYEAVQPVKKAADKVSDEASGRVSDRVSDEDADDADDAVRSLKRDRPSEEKAEAESDDEVRKAGLADAGDSREPQPGRSKEEMRRKDATLGKLEGEARLSPDQRREYLRTLDALSAEKFVEHIATLPPMVVAPPAAKLRSGAGSGGDGAKKSAPQPAPAGAAKKRAPTLDVVLVDRAEADLVRKLLKRGYGKRGARAEATLEMRGADYLDMAVDLTEDELRRVRGWLARLDVTKRQPGAPSVVMREQSPDKKAATGKEKAPRQRVRLRMRFPK